MLGASLVKLPFFNSILLSFTVHPPITHCFCFWEMEAVTFTSNAIIDESSKFQGVLIINPHSFSVKKDNAKRRKRMRGKLRFCGFDPAHLSPAHTIKMQREHFDVIAEEQLSNTTIERSQGVPELDKLK
jgi:hypothetical protein